MKRLLYVAIGLIVVGTIMWTGYALEGAYVDENGFLQEPFHLLAAGWFLNGVSLLVFFMVCGIHHETSILQKPLRPPEWIIVNRHRLSAGRAGTS